MVGTVRVLAAPRTPTRTEREEHDVSHVPYRPWCRFCVMGRRLERRHLTQSGDRDDGRPRVFADYGYLSGDSTPLLVAKDKRTGMTFAAAVSLHVCLRNGSMDWGAKKFLSEQMGSQASMSSSRRGRELRAEGTTTVDEVNPPGDSAGNGTAERATLTVGDLV